MCINGGIINPYAPLNIQLATSNYCDISCEDYPVAGPQLSLEFPAADLTLADLVLETLDTLQQVVVLLLRIVQGLSGRTKGNNVIFFKTNWPPPQGL